MSEQAPQPGSGTHPHTSVIVAGGGVAALETVLALRALGREQLAITLLCPSREMLYRPVTVAEAFDRAQARSFRIDELLSEQGVPHVHDSLESVDVASHTLRTSAGDDLRYDALVIATGARAVSPLPGALSFGGRDAVPALRAMLEELVDGRARSVAFTLTSAQVWTLPIYELALMTAAHLREHGSDARVTLVTPEPAPLHMFGPEAALAIGPMLSELGIALRCLCRPAGVRPGELLLAGGGGVFAERVVCIPEALGPDLAGLPADANGFIPVDAHGRVSGAPGVFAAGDVTALTLKQGGLATQQADAVAEMIAHEAGIPITPRPFSPVLRGLLITPGAPLYLRSEPQRIARRTSVAIDDRSRVGARQGATSIASDQALWWPPAKIAGRYLAPYLATARPLTLTAEPMIDRAPIPGPPLRPDEFDDALELALMLADGDAEWGDYAAALSALDAAQSLIGALPPEYEAKRRLWTAELRGGSGHPA
ncbi:MAG: FAD/NAD(P)-binding oxidoreductase [Solirubrobacteraceae bacterium]